MMPLLATGSIVQKGSSLSMDAELKDGVRPMEKSILEQPGEIPWDAGCEPG